MSTSTWSEGIRFLKIVSGLAVNVSHPIRLMLLLLGRFFSCSHARSNRIPRWRRTLDEFEQLMFGLAKNCVNHFVHSFFERFFPFRSAQTATQAVLFVIATS